LSLLKVERNGGNIDVSWALPSRIVCELSRCVSLAPPPLIIDLRYQLVWKKTAETYRDMCAAEGWSDKKVVEVERIQKQTFQVGCPFRLYSGQDSCTNGVSI
jgi:hypothetical protein